jgi:hypothetical protein
MNNTVKTTGTPGARASRPQRVTIAVALAALLAVPAARADRVSFGLGVGNGGIALGVSVGGRGHHGPAHHHPRHHVPARIAPPCVRLPPPVVSAPVAVVVAPAPVVVAPSGYWQEREERVWVEGCWLEAVDAFGRRCKQWQPGRWEIRRVREWVRL